MLRKCRVCGTVYSWAQGMHCYRRNGVFEVICPNCHSRRYMEGAWRRTVYGARRFQGASA